MYLVYSNEFSKPSEENLRTFLYYSVFKPIVSALEFCEIAKCPQGLTLCSKVSWPKPETDCSSKVHPGFFHS